MNTIDAIVNEISMFKKIMLLINDIFVFTDHSFKVRLRWFRAVLQDSGKHGVSLSSFNITIRVIYH